ncbi:50S ribosomal protein L7/L12 [candidate division WOR-1 bacterium RIFOXYA12_FULL_43_27]|uniref:Large ribosomal subunit protein bL12 n=1 Tax=candidate division WOR-1 bacterium RIFOXYC2_FULL_46_14 TaxID=1802587 RepID=A0A1F4U5Q2_UNCSA|nr:MAG: 50S ribosomal protein L7/L12 [candidate division WOR-1 bacterium RIFOXYA12_FULL_43_27]OGC20453.1 MAG: 50S ribosomal protein L7/L12 [candidate division WOR-1 bacterium RIFOXYB2_FULL_46_45]OGC31810.1 MAG: 50S ribosomal protein L7/L12 [candidate division WOR-1 bacterium RIFOXYA2_FULL_46_56]OGC40298.1 MAG: 50S ribosomal protein L7/L12 [candidate division WOR-1 bacterium RIFOXYC2_FULL_46_14]
MANLDEIVTSVGSLTVLELADLVKKFEEKFGVSAAAPVMAMAGGAGAAAAEEVQDEFDVVLASSGDKKIQVLKVVRELTGLGLKEAKELVDGAPKTLIEKVKKEKAQEAKQKLEAEGAKVEIK